MGRSRRKYKKSKPKVQVALPKRNPKIFKAAFNVPAKLRSLVESTNSKWDEKASVIQNYKSFGFVSDPNLLSVRSRTPHIIQSEALQVPPPPSDGDEEDGADDFETDSGSELEEDDLKSALGKTRRDGKHAPLQPLTAMQRLHIGRLVDKYGDDYQGMFMDIRLNKMQHSVATLKNLCKRYHACGEKNPLIVGS